MANIGGLKSRMIEKYPNELIADVLRNEPNEIQDDELPGKVATWQAIIDTGRTKK